MNYQHTSDHTQYDPCKHVCRYIYICFSIRLHFNHLRHYVTIDPENTPPFPLSELYHTTEKQSTFLAYASAHTFLFLNLIIILNCDNNVKNNAKVLTFISSVI